MKLILPIILSLFIITTIPGIYAESVPDWVKNTAGWWATDAISEKEFVNAIEFLVKNGIIDLSKDCKYYEEEFSYLEEYVKTVLCDTRYSEEFFESEVLENNMDYKFNSNSFRGPEFDVNKSENIFRVFLIGGSTIQGWGVGESETIAHILQNKLNSLETNENFEVINAGFGGAWSKDEIKLVKEKITKLSPDLLIIYDGWNDSLKQSGHHIGFDKDATPGKWVERWDDVCEMSRSENFEIIISIQPLLFSGDKNILTDDENSIYVTHGMSYHNQVLDLLDEYSEKINDFKSCEHTLDLTNAFDNTAVPLFIDTGHVGVKGNEIIAEKFLEHALPIISNKIDKKLTHEFTNYRLPIINQDRMDNNFLGQYIDKINFNNVNIENQKFNAALILNSFFNESTITDSNFRFAIFDNTNFINSKILNSKIPRAILLNSIFSEGIISDSYLSGTTFNQVIIENSEIQNSDLRGSVFSYTNISNTTISDIDFSFSHIDNMSIENSDLKFVNFLNSKILNSKIKSSSFDDVVFKSNDFAGTIFEDIIFNNIEFQDSDFSAKVSPNSDIIPGAIVVNSILKNTNFNSTVFSNIDWEKLTPEYIENIKSVQDRSKNSYFQNAVRIENSNLTNSDFSNTKLDFISLKNSNLTNVKFVKTSLKFVDFTGADLTGANLEGANLEGANLEGANLEGVNLKCMNHKICE